MKKVFASIAVVALVSTSLLTACSKSGDYTCTCTWNFNGTSMTQSVVLKDVKKKDAEKSCNVSYFMAGMSGDCTLD